MIRTASDWISSRNLDKTKSHNLGKMVEIFNLMSGYNEATYVDNNGFISFSEGSPVISLLRLFRGDHFRFNHKPTHLWNDYKYVEGDRDFYLSNQHKYINTCIGHCIDQEYDGVFFLQNPDSKDRHHTVKAMLWANNSKRRVIFKAHPCQGDARTNKDVWSDLESKGLVSEYTVFDDTTDNALLIENAQFVISCQSAVSVQAMLMGKVSVTTKAFDWSEIIPVVDNLDQINMLKPLDIDHVNQFLSWHRRVYSIDIHSDQARERIESRLRGLLYTGDICALLKGEMHD